MKHTITNHNTGSANSYYGSDNINNFSFDGGDLWIRKKIDYVKDIIDCIRLIGQTKERDLGSAYKKYKDISTNESRFSITYSFPDPNTFFDYIMKGDIDSDYLGVKKKDFKYSKPRSPYCYFDLIPFIYRKKTLYIDWIFLKFFLRQYQLDLFDTIFELYKDIKKVHLKENDGLENETRMKQFMTEKPHWATFLGNGTFKEMNQHQLANMFGSDGSFEYYAKESLNVKCPNKNSVSPVDYLNVSPPNHDEYVYGKMEDLEHVQMTKEDKQNFEKFKKIFNKKTTFILDENIKRVVMG
jgi:hypothetical protein